MAHSSTIIENHDSCNGYSKASFVSDKNISFESKIFCDPVHGQITLHPVCVAVIDTPQFQRLRHIRQTAFTEYVYPGATHNRFCHSLGVCYLAGKFLQELKERQPELQISNTDILCVELAGLCHDLGHGPYSHTWESFVNQVNKVKRINSHWKHENVSANMFDYLIKENNLMPLLKQYGICSRELELIKDYIIGIQPKDSTKAYLSQIVNNDDSGLDVDKWDYFLRDCLYLGLPCCFEYERLMQFARVFCIDGKTQICFRDKVLESVYNVFRTRNNLHRLAYQHKVVIITEKMFLDAFHLADGKIDGPSGEVLHFWEWSIAAAFSSGEQLQTALEKFSMLTDDLVYTVLKNISKPEHKRISDLIKAVERRSCKASGFYQHIGLKILSQICDENEVLHGVCKFLPAVNEDMFNSKTSRCTSEENFNPVTPDDIIVSIIPVNWGKGSNNPVDFVHFYTKNHVCMRSSLNRFEVSAMLPNTFEEVQVHVLCRRSDDFALQVSRRCFEKFLENFK